MTTKEDYLKILSTKGLYANTSWPTDHADNKRSKFYPGGLKFDPSKSVDSQIGVTNTKQDQIADPQWLYTRGPDQLWVYGGKMFDRYLAKFNSHTMELEQKLWQPNCVYQGGALMHENGDVYTITGNLLDRFKDGDLSTQPQRLVLPHLNTTLLTISNGLLVLENGYLVFKLFAANIYDFHRLLTGPFLELFGKQIGALFALIFLLGSLSFGLTTFLVSILSFLLHAFTFGLVGSLLYDTFVPESVFPFRFNRFFSIQPGRFLIVDPEAMKIVYQDDFPDKCSFARLTISPKENNQQEIVVLGDHVCQKYVYNYENGSCFRDQSWDKPYRKVGDPTTRGTGPTQVERDIYFTNNTYPETEHCDNYTIFHRNLDDAQVFDKYNLTPPGKKGFMWWSVVSNPAINAVLVWDSLASKVYCLDRQLKGFIWTSNKRREDGTVDETHLIHNNDCLVCSPTTRHVYVTSLEEKFPHIRKVVPWQMETTAKVSKKYLVVLDVESGSELFRVCVSLSPSYYRACNIIIGNDDDVFVGVPNGLARVYSKK